MAIKPLSVNRAWQGQRFKTKDYKVYEKTLTSLLPAASPVELIGPLQLWMEFGLANAASDWDNPIKPTIDVLQKRWGFDDRQIVQAHVRKVKVSKGEEYIKVRLAPVENDEVVDNWF